MFKLLLTKFWPSFIPLLAYIVWVWLIAPHLKNKRERRKFIEIYYTIIATLIAAILSFFYLFHTTNDTVRGATDYTPAQVKNGKIIPGTVK
jgi:hypothetical protein